eukprot:113585-Rhodomonas_salina.1
MCRYHPLTVEALCLDCGGEGICEHAEDRSVCRQCRPTTEASAGDGARVDRITGDGVRQSVPQDETILDGGREATAPSLVSGREGNGAGDDDEALQCCECMEKDSD